MSSTLYATLVELKAWLGITVSTSDDQLTKSLSAASRSIENRTNRQFSLDSAPSQRLYNPSRRTVRVTNSQTRLLVDDIGSASGIVVEIGSGTSFNTVTDYELWPENALAIGLPITQFSRTYMLWQYSTFDRVRVTAQWGWPTVPDEISQATLILAARLFRRQGSPEGVAGFSDLGVVRVGRRDPDVDALLDNFALSVFG